MNELTPEERRQLVRDFHAFCMQQVARLTDVDNWRVATGRTKGTGGHLNGRHE